jgi:hypothetical protein
VTDVSGSGGRAVDAGQAVHLERAGIIKQRGLEEYSRVAFSDARCFWERVPTVVWGRVVTTIGLKAITDLTD